MSPQLLSFALLEQTPCNTQCTCSRSGMSSPADLSLPCNAARIVAPSTDLIVGQGMDRRQLHPLQHATMLALAAASAWEREQWPDAENDSCSPQHATTARGSRAGCAGLSQSEEGSGAQGEVSCQPRSCGLQGAAGCQQGGCSACDAHASDTAAAAAVETSGCPRGSCTECEEGMAHKRQRRDHDQIHRHADSQQCREIDSTPQLPGGLKSSHQVSQAQQQGVRTHHPPGGQSLSGPSTAQALGMDKPYLCTGYDCFIAKEPCIMCAMALVSGVAIAIQEYLCRIPLGINLCHRCPAAITAAKIACKRFSVCLSKCVRCIYMHHTECLTCVPSSQKRGGEGQAQHTSPGLWSFCLDAVSICQIKKCLLHVNSQKHSSIASYFTTLNPTRCRCTLGSLA